VISKYVLTLIANQISLQVLQQIKIIFEQQSLKIESQEHLSDRSPQCEKIGFTSERPVALRKFRKELLAQIAPYEMDIALQTEAQSCLVKKLIFFDLDSTLIKNEGIDECARELHVYPEVAALTEQAMEGKINFDESLRLRCLKLKGLSIEQMEKVYSRLELTEGAEALFSILKKRGLKISIVSGGFMFICERICKRLGADFAFANQLEIKEGKATGQVISPIINAEHKAEILEALTKKEGISLDQVWAVGDGANDVLMLKKSGFGIAFNAKPALKERADFALNQESLWPIIYLLNPCVKDLK
jgi:phosphoserine phosphatase